MLYFFADTKVVLDSESSLHKNQGGVSVFMAGFINYISNFSANVGLVGDFEVGNGVFKRINNFESSSNIQFLLKLFKYSIFNCFKSHDILCFQRPDHLFPTFLCRGKKIIHIHGNQRKILEKKGSSFIYLIYILLESFSLKKADQVFITDKITAVDSMSFS